MGFGMFLLNNFFKDSDHIDTLSRGRQTKAGHHCGGETFQSILSSGWKYNAESLLHSDDRPLFRIPDSGFEIRHFDFWLQYYTNKDQELRDVKPNGSVTKATVLKYDSPDIFRPNFQCLSILATNDLMKQTSGTRTVMTPDLLS